MHIASISVLGHAALDDPQLPVASVRLGAATPLWQVAPKENATSHSGCPGIQKSDCLCVKCQDIGKCIARQGELDSWRGCQLVASYADVCCPGRL